MATSKRKQRACKECGNISSEETCPMCGSNSFADKYKGVVVILNARDSDVAVKLGVRKDGKYALKFN